MLRHFITPSPARTLILLALVCGMVATGVVHAQKAKSVRTVRVFTRDGKVLEGRQTAGDFTVRGGINIPYRETVEFNKRRSAGGSTLNGATSRSRSAEVMGVEQVSINAAAEASPSEAERITAALSACRAPTAQRVTPQWRS